MGEAKRRAKVDPLWGKRGVVYDAHDKNLAWYRGFSFNLPIFLDKISISKEYEEDVRGIIEPSISLDELLADWKIMILGIHDES